MDDKELTLEAATKDLPHQCGIRRAISRHAAGDEHALPTSATIVLGVSAPGWGFGEFTFKQDAEGRLYVDTEYTGVDGVVEFIVKWLMSAIPEYEKDPEKHRRWNEVFKRTCGDDCEVCHPKQSA